MTRSRPAPSFDVIIMERHVNTKQRHRETLKSKKKLRNYKNFYFEIKKEEEGMMKIQRFLLLLSFFFWHHLPVSCSYRWSFGLSQQIYLRSNPVKSLSNVRKAPSDHFLNQQIQHLKTFITTNWRKIQPTVVARSFSLNYSVIVKNKKLDGRNISQYNW